MSDENKKSKIKVTDRRHISQTDEEDDKGQKEGADTPEPEVKEEEAKDVGGPPLEVNFATFLFSLHTQALLHMGIIPDPISKETTTNLEVAKQTIDILGILKDKTRGNLEEEEDKLLNDILYNLRMAYVEKKK